MADTPLLLSLDPQFRRRDLCLTKKNISNLKRKRHTVGEMPLDRYTFHSQDRYMEQVVWVVEANQIVDQDRQGIVGAVAAMALVAAEVLQTPRP